MNVGYIVAASAAVKTAGARFRRLNRQMEANADGVALWRHQADAATEELAPAPSAYRSAQVELVRKRAPGDSLPAVSSSR